MPKSGVLERDPSQNLKKELQRLVKEIVEDSNGFGFEFTEYIDRATQTLQDLKELKSSSFKKLDKTTSCPQEFYCPLSKEIMRDPVVISTGKTFDRTSIQKWLKAGNKTCPRTQEVLTHTVLTPNHFVRDTITQWCKNQGVRFPGQLQNPDENGLPESDHNLFPSLLKKLSSRNMTETKEAAKTLRSLTKRIPSFRSFFGEKTDSIPQLLTPLSGIKTEIDPDLQEDLITTLLNLSIHDSNKKVVAETPIVIPTLLDALRSGTIETRSNAAATLFTLSALDSNKSVIGKAGGLRPLIDLLEEGHTSAIKDAASAIFSLCIIDQNKSRAIRDGAISVLLKKVNENVQVDELLAILAMLSSNQRAVDEMCDLGAVSCLFSLMKETKCARIKENCIVILYAICYSDRTKWKQMREESVYGTLSQLAENGTSRAKRKANGILDRINRPINLTHTA